MDAEDAYRTLGLDAGASPGEVKEAYRRLALEMHPDRSDDDGRRFRKVNEAYNTIKDGCGAPARKERRERKAPARTQWGAPESPPEQDWSKYTGGFEEENPDFWKEYERKFWEDYNRNINADGRNGEHEKAGEPKVRPNLFVDVDPSLCIACQSCETIAPDVFCIDKKSNMNPKSKVINMRGAGLNKIMNAAETCPTKAIIVENADSKKRLYPL